MRRNLTIGVVLVLLLGLVVWWKFVRGSDDVQRGGGSAAVATGSATAGGAGKKGTTFAAGTKVTLSGRVTRKADGSGVAGAIISLDVKQNINAIFSRRRDQQEAPLATADKDGRWKLVDVEPGSYMIGASGKGLLPASRALSVGGSDMSGVDLVLDVGGALVSGTVSDVLGGPIPGAKVQARRQHNNVFESDASITTFTDEKGTYQLALAPGGYMFTAVHDAYTQGGRWLEMTVDPVTIDFTLTPGGSIRGQVVTTDGTPVPGVQVASSNANMRFNTAVFGGGDQTDEQGNFTLKSLAPGALALSAFGGGYSTVSPTIVEVGIGEQVDGVRVVVEKGLSISGRVVEKGTTKGIPGIRVGVFSIAAGETGISREASNDDGAFVIEGLSPASYMMFAIGDEVMPEIGKNVEVVDKDVKDVTLEMASGVTITGRVEPAAVANVSVSPNMVGLGNMFEAMKTFMVRGESDETGAFTLKHAPAGSFKLTAETTDGRAGDVQIVVENVDKTGVVVKLNKRASIAGKVIDSTGAAVTDVQVHARAPQKEGAFAMQINGRGGDDSARTRADGTFLLVGLDAGTYGLSVSDSRGRVAWANPSNKDKPNAPVDIEVAAAADKTGVVLTVEPRDGAIKGVAVMPDGKPAADTWITISMERGKPKDPKKGGDDDFDVEEFRARAMAGSIAPVITNGEGRFSIDKLRRGSYKVVGENAKGSARGQKDNVKTGDTITLQLGRLGTLTGKVTVNGEPVSPYDIECEPASKQGTSHDRRITDKTGVYTLERLPPGEYECDATADAGKATAKVTVPAGDATLDLPLVPWSTVTGTVVSVMTGEPVPGVKLVLGGRGMDKAAITDMLGGKGPTSDAKGAFTIGRVAPGAGSVVVMPATGGFQPLANKDFDAKAGQKVDVGAIKIVPPRTGDPGTLGIGTDTADDKLSVVDIKAGGPGEAAGVRVGDRIMTINGMDVATLTPAIAQTLIGSGNISVGQKFLLGIDRAGTVQQVTVVAAKW